MVCYSPLRGYRGRAVDPRTGRRPVVFNLRDGFEDRPVELPCGQCIGCRLERSRQWAVRCVHEAQMHERNCFVTLTYDDEHLPEDRSVDVREFQRFMKRLRKRYGRGIRFFHCGEYGEVNERPHYHALLFNHDFEDRELWSVRSDVRLYVSRELQSVWPFGWSTLGDVTFNSAAYVARYVLKKVTGQGAQERYQWTHPETGEVHERRPEYVTMSRRPGIGAAWVDRFRSDLYPSDFVVLNGAKMRLPRYYDQRLELDEKDARTIRGTRIVSAKRHVEDQTPDRRQVRKRVQEARLKLLPREL